MIDITRGMFNSAESIQANFQELQIQAGENVNGSWFQFGSTLKVAIGEMTFTKGGSDYVVGDEEHFNIPWPIDFEATPMVFLQPIAYNDYGSFNSYDIETHLVNKWAGGLRVRRTDSGVKEITVQFMMIGGV